MRNEAEFNQTAKRCVTSHDFSQVSETILRYHHIWLQPHFIKIYEIFTEKN